MSSCCSLVISECPICMDDILAGKNVITTECGHVFHSSCLLTNVANNGFDCPMCRNELASYPSDESENGEDTNENGEDDNENDEDEYEYELFDDYALETFRMFYQQLNHEEVEDATAAIAEEYVSDIEQVRRRFKEKFSYDQILDALIGVMDTRILDHTLRMEFTYRSIQDFICNNSDINELIEYL